MTQEHVLLYLEQNRGEIVTGGQLAKELGVSRTTIWKAIHALQEKGHTIEALPNSGYRLQSESDGLSLPAIQEALTTKRFGREMELHKTLHSTNSYIKSLDVHSLPEGFTVLANEQTGGRGRLGRSFASPAHEGIYCSVLLRPEIPLDHIPMLTICAAVAVCKMLEQACGLKPAIKWVNDIYLNGKKVCGILSEAFISAELRQVEYVIVGIGINTGRPDQSVADIATSLLEATGQKTLRSLLIVELLAQFERCYLDFTSGNCNTEILTAYTDRLLLVGEEVEVTENNQTYRAIMQGVDETGALLVQQSDGTSHRLIAGEIRIPQSEEGIS